MSRLESRLKKLEKELKGQTLTVLLKDGSTVKLKEKDILSLLVECMNYAAEVITDEQLSDKAKKIKQAQENQTKIINLMKKMLID